ncbi:tetratricopeptide repeat protein [bacterium]|nr:tetratricopeptide repeat protein [bacterium]
MHRLSHVFGLTLLLGVVSLAGAQDADLPWRSRDCNVHWSGCNWMWLNTHIQAWLTGPDGNDPGPDGASHFKVQNDSKYPCYVSGTAIGIGSGSAAGLVEAGRTRLISLAIPHDKDHPITLITVSFKWVDEAAAEEAARRRAEEERKRQEEEQKRQEEEKKKAEEQRQRQAEEARRQAAAAAQQQAQQAAAQRAQQTETVRQILLQSQQRLQNINQGAEAIAQLITGYNPNRRLTEAEWKDRMQRGYQANDLRAEGDYLYEIGCLDAAMAQYNAALALRDDHDDSYFGRGRVLYDRGEYDEAIAQFTAALKACRYPTGQVEYYCWRARSYLQKGDFGKCLTDCGKVIKLDAKNEYHRLPEAYSLRGTAYALQGKPDLALKDHDQAVQMRPTQEIRLRRARHYISVARYADAIADCSAPIAECLDSKDLDEVPHEVADAYYTRGVARLLAGDATEAKRDAQRSRQYGVADDWYDLYQKVGLPSAPDQAQAEALIRLGGRLYDNGFRNNDRDKAPALFAKAAELCPTSALPRLCHARSMITLDWDQHYADYDAAVRADPDCALARLLRGREICGTERWSEGIADLTRAMELDPELASSATYCTRASAWRSRGNLDAAVDDYTAALRLDATSIDAYFGRGEALRQKGSMEAALSDLNEAIRLAPKHDWALASRGAVYLAKGDTAHALADLNEAIRLRPKYPWAQYVRAAVYLRQGDQTAARADAMAAKQQRYTSDWLQVYQTLGL